MLPALPTLLGIGTPAHFLLEILDSTELRPGGGFIGNYGIATFHGGRLTTAHITDTYLLDKPFESAGHTIPYPPAYSWFAHYLAPSSWSLRDSNLDADFPTAARYGESNYEREGGNVPLQGVIAITPSFIEQVLNITGPIEYAGVPGDGDGAEPGQPYSFSSVEGREEAILFLRPMVNHRSANTSRNC